MRIEQKGGQEMGSEKINPQLALLKLIVGIQDNWARNIIIATPDEFLALVKKFVANPFPKSEEDQQQLATYMTDNQESIQIILGTDYEHIYRGLRK